MINTIKYYYNLNVNEIKEIDDDYYLDNNYVLKFYYRNLNIDLYNTMIINNNYVHKIIYNKDNNFITTINNKPYIMLEIFKVDSININFIENYNYSYESITFPNWALMWEEKIDYFEKNIDDIKDNNILDGFNYYVGMVENAISLYKKIHINSPLYVSHIRLENNIEFYDPLNIILDYKVRDIAEYIKKEIYKNKNYDEFIKKFIYKNNYNDNMLFFCRMLYPTNFFDQYDKCLKGEKIDYDFLKYKDKEFNTLKTIYRLIKTKYQIVNISWLE